MRAVRTCNSYAGGKAMPASIHGFRWARCLPTMPADLLTTFTARKFSSASRNADRIMSLRACTQLCGCRIKSLFDLQLDCAMPVSVRDGALLGAGMTLVAASTFFYRRKQTLPFKVRSRAVASPRRLSQTWLDVAVKAVLLDTAQVAYFLSWPVLGSAVILAWQPSPGEMSHMVKDSGIANETQLHDVRFCKYARSKTVYADCRGTTVMLHQNSVAALATI